MYRNEYPRPQFVREEWLNLNGEWEFEFDDQELGESEKWYYNEKDFSAKIQVPFPFQSSLSGIEDTTFHDIIWYKREVKLSKEWKDKKMILHFGAVDFRARIYVNEVFVGEHEGGNTSFSFDITNYLTWGEKETITVRAEDPSVDESIPRGKQYWKEKSAAIWYTRTSGIWQTVWIEPVEKAFIKNLKITPYFDEGEVEFDFSLTSDCMGKRLSTEIFYQGKKLVSDSLEVNEQVMRRKFYLFNNEVDRSEFHGVGWSWRPEDPNLFDVSCKIENGDKNLDTVASYFGMRKIHTEKGMVYLNNGPYYQKLILDQGYWEKGILTAATDEDFIKDILMAKEMGFNGCRKHQKVEDPRFLYWADKLGFLVWGECASPSVYTDQAAKYLTREWMEIIERDYNHPCIIAWTPINESWGVLEIGINRVQQHYSQAIYHLIHALDNTRLVLSNDGWEMTETDICGIHTYIHGSKEETEKWNHYKDSISTKGKILASQPNRRRIYCNSFEHKGEPIMLTEFGGIGYSTLADKGWGYTGAEDEETFVKEYERLIKGLYESKILTGFCYTQLSDVEQEQNGLLTYGREYKCNPEKIKKINDMWHREVIEIE